MGSTISGRMAAMALAVASLMVVSAHAQDGPEFFGGADGTTTIPAMSFRGLPFPDANGFSKLAYQGFPGNSASGTAELQLPNGSEITQLCVVAFDDSWHGETSLTLVAWEYPRIGTTTPTQVQTLARATSGYGAVSGMSTYCAPLAAPILVKSFGDLNANGVSGWTGYTLQGSMAYGPTGGFTPDFGSLSFGAAVVVWRRTVSPAPAVATFTDVPTWHPQFRHVEALVASGITGGCAPGRFCPDVGITRGQFAVFLSVALGLHYPN